MFSIATVQKENDLLWNWYSHRKKQREKLNKNKPGGPQATPRKFITGHSGLQRDSVCKRTVFVTKPMWDPLCLSQLLISMVVRLGLGGFRIIGYSYILECLPTWESTWPPTLCILTRTLVMVARDLPSEASIFTWGHVHRSWGIRISTHSLGDSSQPGKVASLDSGGSLWLSPTPLQQNKVCFGERLLQPSIS